MVRYPLWICEGLATCFETQSPWQAFGPGFDNAPRRSRFVELLKKGSLLKLRELVAIARMDGRTSSEAKIEIVYQQSYGFVSWLTRARPAQLATYLRMVRREPPGEIATLRHIELFTEAFGNIEKLEREWLRHESQ